MSERIAIVGGTGKLGQGLALRLAQAGHPVLIGSRTEEKAVTAAAAVADDAPGVDLVGLDNARACQDAELVFVTVPYEAQRDTLAPLANVCAGKVVVCCTAPLDFSSGGPAARQVDAGSAAEECALLLPESRVVAGFQLVPAPTLRRPDAHLDMDVPLVGDDESALEVAVRVTNHIGGLRGVPAGPLRLAASLEGLTPLLLSINRRHKAHAGIRLTGV